MRDAGIPVGVLCSPMIPMINDSELESLLTEAHAAGAQSAAYMMLRLPLEVAPLFEEWLTAHYPQRAAHVMSLVRQVRGGRCMTAGLACACAVRGRLPICWRSVSPRQSNALG